MTDASGERDELPATGGAESLELLAAALRQDSADVAVYARVLSTTLADVLPPGTVTVERDRSLADRLAGREGEVRAVHVRLAEQVLSLRAGRTGPEGEIQREVRGIVLSREQVGLDVWTERLAAAVAAAA